MDQTYYEAHADWDQSADQFLGRNASGVISVNGRDVLMFTAGGQDFKTDPKLLADTWSIYKTEFLQAYTQTPISLASEKFATQKKILDADLTAVRALPFGGGIIATLVQYDEAARQGDTQTMRDIEANLPLDLAPLALELGRLASGIKAAGKAQAIGEQEKALGLGYDSNKINHIFGKPTHMLDPLVTYAGSQEAAMVKIDNAAQSLINDAISLRAGTWISVDGFQVWVRGAIVDGRVRVGTASMNTSK